MKRKILEYVCVSLFCVSASQERVERGLSGSWELAGALLQQALLGLTCVFLISEWYDKAVWETGLDLSCVVCDTQTHTTTSSTLPFCSLTHYSPLDPSRIWPLTICWHVVTVDACLCFHWEIFKTISLCCLSLAYYISVGIKN